MSPASRTDSRPGDGGSACPDAELMAVYIDGRASAAESAGIESHLGHCDDCLLVFSETTRHRRAELEDKKKRINDYVSWDPRRRWIPRLAVAAAIILAVFFYPSFDQTDEAELDLALSKLESAVGSYRRFEPRLTVDATYREMQSVTRSAGDVSQRSARNTESEEALRSAAANAEDAARNTRDRKAGRQALGLMYLRLGDAVRAVDALEPLSGSQDPGVLNDLAAAYLSRRAAGDTQRALDLLERAVSLDPQRVAAWFNLGLAADAEGRRSQAIEAWTQALKRDATPGWTEETRWRLQKLTTQ